MAIKGSITDAVAARRPGGAEPRPAFGRTPHRIQIAAASRRRQSVRPGRSRGDGGRQRDRRRWGDSRRGRRGRRIGRDGRSGRCGCRRGRRGGRLANRARKLHERRQGKCQDEPRVSIHGPPLIRLRAPILAGIEPHGRRNAGKGRPRAEGTWRRVRLARLDPRCPNSHQGAHSSIAGGARRATAPRPEGGRPRGGYSGELLGGKAAGRGIPNRL